MIFLYLCGCKVIIVRHILSCASSVRAAQAFILRHILSCASSLTFLRSSFALAVSFLYLFCILLNVIGSKKNHRLK